MEKNIDKIFDFIKDNPLNTQFNVIKEYFSFINESTLIRNLNKLIEEEKIIKETK